MKQGNSGSNFVISGSVVAIAAALMSVPSMASAQEESPAEAQSASTGLADIVVTARRRQESVQTTPLSVSALDSSALEERNVQNISEVTRLVPNVQFDGVASEAGAASSQISIRGIGQTDYVITVEPGVGVYLDGVYVGKSLGSLLDTVDIERVEVLRGPQGTLFGKNTIGGAIQLISKRPTADPEYSLELTTGRFSRFDAKAVMSGPLSSAVRYRFSGAYQSRKGFMNRVTPQRVPTGEHEGNINRLSGRLVIEADLSDNLMATLALDGTRIREQSPPSQVVRISEAGGFPALFNAGVPGGVCAVTAGPSRFSNPICINSQYENQVDSFQTFNVGGNTANTDVKGAGLTLEWRLGDLTLKSITGYRDVSVLTKQNLGGTQYYTSQIGQDIDAKQFSQEFQANGSILNDKLQYVLGLYYIRETGTQIFPVNLALAQFVTGGRIRNNSYAAFGQITYDITDALSITGGLRYTYEDRNFNTSVQTLIGYEDIAQVKIPGFVNPVAGAFGAPGTPLFPHGWYKRTSKSATPMVSASYKVSPDVMAYATYSKGFKGGGFTMRYFPPVRPAPGVDPNDLISYAKPETATAYEVGLKSELFDRRLRLNVAAFWTDYKDIQVTYVVDPDGPGPIGRFVPVLANSGAARMRGVEVEAAAVLADWLRFDGSLGYIDAEYRSFTPAALEAFPNALELELPNTSKWTFNVGATATLVDNEAGNLSVRADFSHRSGQFKEFSNDPDLFQPAYGILNASVTFRTDDRLWDITLGGTNITDKAYIVSGVSSSDRAIAVRSRPAEWFLKVGRKF